MRQNICRSRDRGGLWLGKLTLALSRRAGKGGTTLPGRVATAFAPTLLPSLAAQVRRGNLVVTGTNGKTTSSYLLAMILRLAGSTVIHNRTGANLTWGIASAYIDAASWNGLLKRDYGIMESDEATFHAAIKALKPRGALVTNIFRDQLDRYGEITSIRSMIQQGLGELPAGSFVILNADDPSVASLELRKSLKTIYFGLELPQSQPGYLNTAHDLKACPLCGKQLIYSRIYFAHLGRYRCPACTFRRPEADYKLLASPGSLARPPEFLLAAPGQKLRCNFPLPGLYNLYNALAAAACAHALGGVKLPVIINGLGKAEPSFGRMERFIIKERPLSIGLIKNPVGANEVLRTFLEKPGRLNFLFAINDHYADGTDISWLWDVDFEQILPAAERIASLSVSGTRAADMAVRLKYAGLPLDRITFEQNLKKALLRAIEGTSPGEALYILPTYTAMLELRKIIYRLGFARPFWEE